MRKPSIVSTIHSFRPNLGINTVRAGFAKFPIVLLIWCLMKISILGVYVAFCCWATRRLEYAPNCKFKFQFDCFSIDLDFHSLDFILDYSDF